MRAQAAFLCLVLLGCQSHGRPEDDDAGMADAGAPLSPDAPEADGEARLYVENTAEGLRVVRVRPDGEIAPWGPLLPLERPHRMLQSSDARRVLIQAGETYALRGDRWESICSVVGTEQCSATDARDDLSVFLAQPAYGEGREPALVSYRGEHLVGSDGRRALHSREGWSVVTSSDGGFVHWAGGVVTPIARHDGELLHSAIGHSLFTRDIQRNVWQRAASGDSRDAVACPDGTVLGLIAYGARADRCGDEWVALGDAGLERTGHLVGADDDGSTYLTHIERGAFTFVTRSGHPTHTSTVAVLAPSGELLARHDYDATEVRDDTYTLAVLGGFRADPDRLVAHVRFSTMQLAHDDIEIAREDGFFVWERGAPEPEWHVVSTALESDDSVYMPVWFPESADRALWLTNGRRLLGFDYRARTWLDIGEDRRFELVASF